MGGPWVQSVPETHPAMHQCKRALWPLTSLPVFALKYLPKCIGVANEKRWICVDISFINILGTHLNSYSRDILWEEGGDREGVRTAHDLNIYPLSN